MRRTDFSEVVLDNISLKWFEDSVPCHQVGHRPGRELVQAAAGQLLMSGHLPIDARCWG